MAISGLYWVDNFMDCMPHGLYRPKRPVCVTVHHNTLPERGSLTSKTISINCMYK